MGEKDECDCEIWHENKSLYCKCAEGLNSHVDLASVREQEPEFTPESILR